MRKIELDKKHRDLLKSLFVFEAEKALRDYHQDWNEGMTSEDWAEFIWDQLSIRRIIWK